MTEENRQNMTKSLNNYQKTIDEMLNLINSKINNTYNNLIENNSDVFFQILENIQTKINEFKEKQNELLTQVSSYMQLTDDFDIYSKLKNFRRLKI